MDPALDRTRSGRAASRGHSIPNAGRHLEPSLEAGLVAIGLPIYQKAAGTRECFWWLSR